MNSKQTGHLGGSVICPHRKRQNSKPQTPTDCPAVVASGFVPKPPMCVCVCARVVLFVLGPHRKFLGVERNACTTKWLMTG